MRKILFALIILSLFLPGIVSADGVIFPPPDRYVAETDQKAVLFYDKGIETLILSITFTGNAKDFAWVVPTPSRPEVDKASSELFLSLEELTRPPIHRQWDGYNLGAAPAAMEKSAVEVLETKEVGIYEIKVLAASKADALARWLSENGYQFPEKGGYVLEDYIKNKWYYTAVKIRPEVVWKDVMEKLRTGQAVPLKLTFKSDKIVYPLKITSLTSLWQTPEPKTRRMSYPEQEIAIAPGMPYPYPYQDRAGVLLYVFDNCEKSLPGFNTQYAEIIEGEEIEDLAYDDQGEPWMKTKKDFVLTKLYRNMKFTEMNDDLILRDAKNGLTVSSSVSIFPFNSNEVFEEEEGFLKNFLYTFIALIVWAISPVGLIFLICAFLLFTVKSKFVRFLAWLGQGLAIFGWVSIMFWLIIARSRPFQENIFQLNREYLDAGILAGIILMSIILIIILGEILYRRKITDKKSIDETTINKGEKV